jgi:hypothetical protein
MRQQWRIPIICILAAIFLILYQYLDLAAAFQSIFPPINPIHPAKSLYHRLSVGCGAFVFLGLLPATAGCLLLDERPSDWGFGLGPKPLETAGLMLLFLLLLFPALFYVSSVPSFTAGHPKSLLASWYPKALLLYELGTFAMLLGWESFFRGFLLFGLHKKIGNTAIYVLVIPAVILELQKSPMEALAAIPIAVFLGHLAVMTRSIWYGFFLYWLCLLSFDLLIIYKPF